VDSPHAIRAFALPYARLLALAGPEAGLPPDGDFGLLHQGLHRDRETLGLLERLWAEGARGARHGGLWADGLVLQVVARLLHLSGRAGPRQPRGGLAPWQVRRVAEHVEANLASDISLAELARLVGLSPNHFCTAFRISLGDPPHRHLARRRVARARELLADPRLSVTDVALAVGFGSSAHFATAFKAQVGSTPTAYRRDVLS
jgi:AraC family transcriptional regulator